MNGSWNSRECVERGQIQVTEKLAGSYYCEITVQGKEPVILLFFYL